MGRGNNIRCYTTEGGVSGHNRDKNPPSKMGRSARAKMDSRYRQQPAFGAIPNNVHKDTLFLVARRSPWGAAANFLTRQ